MDSVLQIIVDTFKDEQPEKIILFGSRAYGKPQATSDYDICLIKSFPAETPDEYNTTYFRLYDKLSRACPNVLFDFLLYLPDVYDNEKDEMAYVAYDISRKGKVLYDVCETHV